MTNTRNLLGVAIVGSRSSPALAAQPGQIGIDLTPVAESRAAHAGTTYRVAVQARLDAGFHVNSNEPLEEFLIATALSLNPPDGIQVDGFAWPEPIMLSQKGADQLLAVFEEEFVIGAALSLDPSLALGTHTVPGVLRYQACDETMCYLPATAALEFTLTVVPSSRAVDESYPDIFARLIFDVVPPDESTGDPARAIGPLPVEGIDALTHLDRFTVLGTTGGYLDADQFLEFIDRAASGRQETSWFEGRGPLAILVLVLVGGLALNLTPCVLPLIPINLAIIGAGAKTGSRSRGFALGSAYGLGMAAVYGILGLVVILSAGTFGAVNASPWFNLAIATLFLILGLAMFDVLTIDFSRFQNSFSLGGATGNRSFLVASAMGGVAALLAGACVAPVVIQVIVFSSSLYASGTSLALALPFILGLGMALPWPIAGAGLSVIPRPGPWMVRIKQAFGVFILGTAFYYGSLAYGLFSQKWVNPEEVAKGVQEMLEEGWYGSLVQGLQVAQQEQNPVLVDVWATWCKNCLTMDMTTLKDPAVEAALAGYVKIKFQAEDPSVSPASAVMERFQGVGLPTYAILRPSGADPTEIITIPSLPGPRVPRGGP